jgi:hypothetical protein
MAQAAQRMIASAEVALNNLLILHSLHRLLALDPQLRRAAADNWNILRSGPTASVEPSRFRVTKTRILASVALSTRELVAGCFFVADVGANGSVPERVAEILNAERGFFPFEAHEDQGLRTVLFHSDHIVTVTLAEAEARREPGYDVATMREVAVRLSDGRRLRGTVRVHRPEGRDRLSDWARHPDRFRYLEVGATTVIVNVAHVIELSEDVDS